jgi:catechol 2,3-dioxygenase-like lactoylglutathione lyase family enzyme
MTKQKMAKATIHRLWTVRVFVSDQEAAIEFFRDIMELPVILYAPRYGWVELGPDDDRAKIAFVEPNPDADPIMYEWQLGQIGRDTGITFETQDLDGFYKKMKKRGVRFFLLPEEMPWGGMMAGFEDPDGNRYTIVEDPEHYTRDYS